MNCLVFLGGPNERPADDPLFAIKKELDKFRHEKYGYSIQAYRWSEPPDGDPRVPAGGTQDRIDPKLAEASIVVMMFRDRLGSPHPDPKFASYSVYELETAIDLHRKSADRPARPQILICKANQSWSAARDEDLVAKSEEEVDAIRNEERRKREEHWKLVQYLERLRKENHSEPKLYQIYSGHRDDEHLIDEVVKAIKVIAADLYKVSTVIPEEPPLKDFDGWPYRGLTEYTDQYWNIFYGRELQKTQALEALKEKRLLAIYGSSGTGKTSFLKAGIIGSLKHGTAKERGKYWRFIQIEPRSDGTRFSEAVAVKLEDPLVGTLGYAKANASYVTKLLDDILADPGPGVSFDFVRAAERLRKEIVAPILPSRIPGVGVQDNERILAFAINQGEYVAATEAPDRDKFLRFIIAAVICDSRVRVLMTLRSEVLGTIASNRAFDTQLREFVQWMPLYSPDQIDLQSMIEGPAKLADLKVEPQLVRKLLQDVAMRSAQDGVSLPLVAQFLNRLAKNAEEKGKKTMTLEDMKEIGELSTVVEMQAQKLEQYAIPEAFNHLFAGLVGPGPGGSTLIREIVSKQELLSLGVPNDLLNMAIGERLLEEVNDGKLRLSHDILFDAWPRLREWAQTERRNLELRGAIVDDALRWEKYGKDDRDIRLSEGYLSDFESSRRLESMPEGRRSLVRDYVKAAQDKSARQDLVAAVYAGSAFEVLSAINRGARLTADDCGEGVRQLRHHFWAAVTGEYDPDFFPTPAEVNATVSGGLPVSHLAALCGSTDLLRFLVQTWHVDLARTSDRGSTILSLAAYGGHLDVCEYLLSECGLDASLLDRDGTSAAFWAMDRGHEKLSQFLSERGSPLDVKTSKGWNRLTGAVQSGVIASVLSAIEAGFSPHEPNEDGVTQVMTACLRVHPGVLRLLLAEYGADATARDKNGDSAFDFLCTGIATLRPSDRISRGDEVVRLLVKHGLDIDVLKEDGSRPLLRACSDGSVELVQILIRHGAKVEVIKPSVWSPLEVAIGKGRRDVVEVLLSEGVNVEAPDDKGLRPLHIASMRGDSDIIEVLLARGKVEVDPIDQDGDTPLMLASAGGRNAAVSLLLKHQASIRLQNENGRNAFDKALNAFFQGDIELGTVAMLVAADNESQARPPQTESVAAGHREPLFRFEQFVSILKLRVRDEVKRQLIQLIASIGCDLNQPDEKGQTYLHWLVRGEAPAAMIRTSLPFFEVAREDSEGKTALDLATESGQEETARIITDFMNIEVERLTSEPAPPS